MRILDASSLKSPLLCRFQDWLQCLFWLQIIAFFTSISLMDLFSTLSALVLAGLLYKFPQERVRFVSLIHGPLLLLLLGYVLSIWVSLIASPSTLSQIWAPALEPKWILLMWVFAYQWSLQPNEKTLGQLLTLGVLATALLCLSQVVLHIDPTRPSFLPLDPLWEGYRATGFFSYAMTFAHTFNLLFFFFLGATIVGQKIWWGSLLLFFLGLVAIVVSHTRGVWFGLPVGVMVVLSALPVKTKIKIQLAATAIGFAVVVFLVYEPLQERLLSIFNFENFGHSERLNLWRTNWSLFLERPALGWGYLQNYYQLDRKFLELGIPSEHFKGHAHNQWLQYLSTIGVVGTTFFIGIIIWFLKTTIQLLCCKERLGQFKWGIVVGCLAAQLSWLIGGLTQVNFEDSKVRFVLIFLWAAILAFDQPLKKGVK